MDEWKNKKVTKNNNNTHVNPESISYFGGNKFFKNNNGNENEDISSLEVDDKDYVVQKPQNIVKKPITPQIHTFNKNALTSPHKSNIVSNQSSTTSFKWNEYEKNHNRRQPTTSNTIPQQPNKFQEFKQKLSSPIKSANIVTTNNTVSSTPNISNKPFKYQDSPTSLKGKLSFPKHSDSFNNTGIGNNDKLAFNIKTLDKVIHSKPNNTTPNKGIKRQLSDYDNNYSGTGDGFSTDYTDYNKNDQVDDNSDEDTFTPTQEVPKPKPNQHTVKNNQGKSSTYLKRNDSFKDDQKYFGSLLRQSSQVSISTQSNDDQSQPSTQLVNDNNFTSTQTLPIPGLSQAIPQPIFNIIRSTSQLSINNEVIKKQKEKEIKNYHPYPQSQVRSDTHDSIEDNDDDDIVKSHPNQSSPPPPQFKVDSIKHQPPKPIFRYVKEEIEEDNSINQFNNSGGNNLFSLKRGTLKDDIDSGSDIHDESIFTPNGSRKVVDVIVDDDDDTVMKNHTDDEGQGSTNPQLTNSTKKPIKSKWLDDLSDSIINSTLHNQLTPVKTFKISKKKNNVRGGLCERLNKLLLKEKVNYDILTKRSSTQTVGQSSISQRLLNQISNHYNTELKIKIVQIPFILQPHVYVTQCICYNWPDSNSDETSIQLIQVIFAINVKSELKLELNSNLIVDYWQKLIVNQDKITIYSHIAKLDATSTHQDISIDDLKNDLSSKVDITPISLIYRISNQQAENSDEQTIANLDITELEDVNQHLVDINIRAVILQSFQRQDNSKVFQFPENKPISMLTLKDLKMKSKLTKCSTSNDQDAVSIFISSLNGFVAEIQIPAEYIESWKALTDSIFCECLFADLQFIRNINLYKSSNFSTFLRHYIPIDYQQAQMNLTVFRVKPTSYFMVNTEPNPLFSHYYKPLPIQTINETILNLLYNRYEANQRISIQGEIINIQPINKKTQSFIIFLIDNQNTTIVSDPQHQQLLNTISVQISSNSLHYNHSSFKVGQLITIQLCIVQTPFYPISSILMADEFSMLSVEEDPQQQQQQIQIYNTLDSNHNINLLPKYSLSTFSSIYNPSSTSNSDNDGLEDLNYNKIFYNYIFIDKFLGQVTEVECKNSVYRGCKICKALVIQLKNDLFKVNQERNEGFCQECRIIVDSELLIELNLIIQLNDGSDTCIKLKMSSAQCVDLLQFPLEYSLVDEYRNIIQNLKSKLIEFNGLAYLCNSDGIVYNIDCLSPPIFK